MTNEQRVGARITHWPLAWLPVPLAIMAIIALWALDTRVIWTVPVLSWFVHYGCSALGVAFIVIPAARGFIANGQPAVMMLGCGVLMSEIGAAAMPIAMTQSLSQGFAIYNTSVLLSALCHFVGVAVTSRRRFHLKHSITLLVAVYAAGVAVMGVVIWASFTGVTPAFFVDNHGGTLVRSLVVSVAVVLFLMTALILLQSNRKAASLFLSWYALGLVLFAVGLAGSMLISVKDSPLQWVTRFTQVLGTVYMCVAVLASYRRTGAWRIPNELTLATAGPHFEKLFELSGDGIVVHESVSEASRGNFLQVNDAFCRMLGYTLVEIHTLGMLDVLATDEKRAVPDETRALKDPGTVVHQRTLLAKDGRAIPAEISSRQFSHRGRSLVLSIIRDISERTQAEAQILKKSEELHQRNKELEFFNRTMVGRELRMIELKKEVDELCRRLGEAKRYGVEVAEGK